jgi:hypothetical protein
MHRRSDKTLDDLARVFNPYIRGWINYYSHFYRSALYWTRVQHRRRQDRQRRIPGLATSRGPRFRCPSRDCVIGGPRSPISRCARGSG